MAGRLIRKAIAMIPATSMWTGRGRKQMARPTPKALVTARRWSVHRRGSAIRSPNGRRYQRFCREPGDGQIFFSRRRGMRRKDCTKTIRKESALGRNGSFNSPEGAALDNLILY